MEKENAAELIFGDKFDFEKITDDKLKCLTNDQVFFLLSSNRNNETTTTTTE